MPNSGSMVRLFFALPGRGIQEALMPVHRYLSRFRRELKTVDPEQYHITMKFLGETRSDILVSLLDDFRALDPGIPALPYTLRGLGAFPDIRRPRVIWCNLDLDLASLERMRLRIEDLAARHGFPRESRPFKTHLTLARVRRDMKVSQECMEYIRAGEDAVFGESVFDNLVLYKSELGSEGPRYTALVEKPLK